MVEKQPGSDGVDDEFIYGLIRSCVFIPTVKTKVDDAIAQEKAQAKRILKALRPFLRRQPDGAGEVL